MSEIYWILLYGTNKYYKDGKILNPDRSLNYKQHIIVKDLSPDHPVPNCRKLSRLV